MVPGIHAGIDSKLCAAPTDPSVRNRHASGSGVLSTKE